jgi:energy-converting hydrogenase Eha subunit H
MIRGSLMRKWTDEERLEHRKWARGVAFCYGLAACLLFGAIALNLATTGTMDRLALAPLAADFASWP